MLTLKKIRLLISYLLGHKMRVTAAIIEKDSLVLIARRKIGSALGGKWEFPGGKIEPGESSEECLKREMKEEFGIEVEVKEFIASNKFRYFFVPLELLAYRVTHLSGEFEVRDHEEIKWVAKNELRNYNFLPADKPIVSILSQ